MRQESIPEDPSVPIRAFHSDRRAPPDPTISNLLAVPSNDPVREFASVGRFQPPVLAGRP